MTHLITRNSVVALLGTPHAIEGSLNDPVEREVFGNRYNEKWTYQDLRGDPSGVPNRIIYWLRYDFATTMVRADDSEEWRGDTTLIEAANAINARLNSVDDHHPAYPKNDRYRPVSTPQDWRDLGGYVQDETTGKRVGEER
jgi:hypothetical protein